MTLKLSVPEIWKVVPLHKATEVVMGQSPAGEFVNQAGEGVPFFQGKAEFGELHPKPRKYCTQPKKMALPGDVLLSVRAPVGPTNLADKESCIGRGLSAVRAAHGVDGKYLFHYFRNIESWMSQQGTGSTFKAVSGGFIKELPFALPPLAEQKVIADKLDELLAQVNNLKARLDAIPAILKRFRQSVLTAAVSGKLVEEWREQSNTPFSYPNNLLADVILEMRNGLSSKPNEHGDGYPILRISSVRPFVVDQHDTRFLDVSEKDKERYSLNVGDLLFTRYNGSAEFFGVCGRVNELHHGTLLYPDKLIRVRVNEEKVSSKYLEIFSASRQARSYVQPLIKSTSGQKGVSGKDLKKMVITMPSSR